MQKDHHEILITREDHKLITRYINALKGIRCIDWKSITLLLERLRNAIDIDKDHFPGDVARLHSTVIVKNLQTNLAWAYTIVLPRGGDKRNNKVSVLSSIGAALLGLKKGQRFSWERLAREKNFLVLEVYNSPSLERACRQARLTSLLSS